MATQSDVETALGQLIGLTLYPAGAAGEAASPVVDHPVRVEAGWPTPAALDAAMKGGKSHVSIYPLPGERNVTRYPTERQDSAVRDPTYGITLTGQLVTITGAAPGTYFAHNFAIVVDGYPYIFQALDGHTPADVAAGLYDLVSEDFPSATIAGAVITLPDTARMGSPRLGTVGDAVREVRRQEKQFQISVWSSSPDSRAAVSDAFDSVLADTPFLTLADGSQARLTYHGSREDDFTQKQRIYRRTFVWCVEYGTTRSETATQIIAPLAALLDAADGVIVAIPSRPAAESAPGSGFGTLDATDPDELILFTTV